MSTATALTEIVERISDPVERVGYVRERIPKFVGISRWHTNRGALLTAQVLSVPYEWMAEVLSYLLLDQPERVQHFVADLNPSRVGFVYFARDKRDTTLLKVGFSATPEKRVKRISIETGRPFEIVDLKIGTMLDEHVEHCQRRHLAVSREFFREPIPSNNVQ